MTLKSHQLLKPSWGPGSKQMARTVEETVLPGAVCRAVASRSGEAMGMAKLLPPAAWGQEEEAVTTAQGEDRKSVV